MARGKRHPKVETPDDLDELDLEIVAALSVNPKTSCRAIGEKTGNGITTIWERIQRIRKSDWITQMRDELKALSPKLIEAIDAGVTDSETLKDRASIAINVLRGLGALSDKQSLEHSGPGGQPLNSNVHIYLPDNGRDDKKKPTDDKPGTGGTAKSHGDKRKRKR